jgi:hypothetical protein
MFGRAGTFFAILIATASAVNPLWGEALTLDYPDTNARSRPILEFRARSVAVHVGVAPPTIDVDGHAFVLFGREAADGTIQYYAAAGFSPTNESIKQVLNTPGHIEFGPDGLNDPSDIKFQVRITAEQERLVRFVLKEWNDKEYRVLSQNCVSLVKSISKVIGLDAGDPKSVVTPFQLVRLLKNENDRDKPLRKAVIDAARADANRKKDAAVVKDIVTYMQKRQEEVKQSQEAYRRWQQGVGQSVGISITGSGGMSGGVGGNPFPIGTMMHATWPWEPPSPGK